MAKPAPERQPRTAPPPGDNHDRVTAAVSRLLAEQMSRPLAPGLYLVATPIGNLGDVTLRAVAVMALADQLYCEDTRHSRKLLAQCGIDRPLSVYEEHGANRERPKIIASLARGHAVAIISDAGTPLISDPGFKLARAAIEAGHTVTVVPGATAGVAALTVSGQPTDRFAFEGFLPPKSAARQTRLKALATHDAPSILYEAPNRLAALLNDCVTVLGADRNAAVARELTKLHEEVRRGTVAELAAWAEAEPPRGEIVVILAPAPPRELSDAEIVERIVEAMTTQSFRDAVRHVTDATGAAKSRVYEIGLAFLREEED